MNLKIGTTIKHLRQKHQVTQEQLATFCGVTPQAISRWEAGNGYPDIELLPTIAEYFSVSMDDLFGISISEKEKRRSEIYDKMRRTSEIGADKSKISEARQYVAEFPSDAKIRKNLADVLCQANMWDEFPNPEALAEAEKIYRVLIETADDGELKNAVIYALAALYGIGYKDLFKAEQTIRMLPGMRYCRESAASIVISSMMNTKHEYAQDYISRLTEALGTALEEYIIDILPNQKKNWNGKIKMLRFVISLYQFVGGENLLYYHSRVANIYRLIATYRLSQKKYKEALDCLEKMCEHSQKSVAAKPGDKFTSPFLNLLEFPATGDDFDWFEEHNDAWYELQKLKQNRYDPIRETPRFTAIVEKLKAIET